MAYQSSPGVNWSEIDLTTAVRAPSTSVGAFVGEFDWGPLGEIYTVSSEDTLANVFGKPSSNIAKVKQVQSFWTAANFLSYSNNLKVVRAAHEGVTLNATDGSNTAILIRNQNDYIANNIFNNVESTSYANSAGMFAARYPGSRGNGLKVSVFPASAIASANNLIWKSWPYSNQFPGEPTTSPFVKNVTKTNSYDEMHVVVIDTLGNFSGVKGSVLEKFSYVSKASDALNPDGTSNYWVDVLSRQSKYVYALNNSQNTYTDRVTTVATQAVDANCNWGMTSTDLLNLQVRSFIQPILPFPAITPDSMPLSITGTVPTSQVINVTNASGNASSLGNPQYWYTSTLGMSDFNMGVDSSPTDGDIINGYKMFMDKDSIDISLILTGSHNFNVIQHVIDEVVDGGNLTDTEEHGIITPTGRKDCVVFVSPPMDAVVNNKGNEVTSIFNWLNSINNYSNSGLDRFSSYVMMDSGWKKQYDKYNDTYRWIPLNADIAGLCARTDLTNASWWSPAGLNRGQIKNVTQLAWNPNKRERDELYQNAVNPVIQLTGVGPILFGDKTLTNKPSAFDRINVRRLFIYLEKSISNSAKYSLFEFNDEYTRAAFVATIEPFLRDIKGKRGIYDYRVVCDETNNTPQIIDSNQFVGDIYIKPARSINYIQLNFIAVSTGVDFSTVVGSY